jgi:hypothetical protein
MIATGGASGESDGSIFMVLKESNCTSAPVTGSRNWNSSSALALEDPEAAFSCLRSRIRKAVAQRNAGDAGDALKPYANAFVVIG